MSDPYSQNPGRNGIAQVLARQASPPGGPPMNNYPSPAPPGMPMPQQPMQMGGGMPSLPQVQPAALGAATPPAGAMGPIGTGPMTLPGMMQPGQLPGAAQPGQLPRG